MAVPVDRLRVEALIEQQYGSVDELVGAWELRHDAAPRRTVRPRDRSTIYKWLDAGLPAKRDVLYGFCALLGVDPIGIIESSRSFIETNFAKERRAFQMSDKRDTILAPFRDVYLPGWRWPNHALAKKHYGHDWCIAELEHNAKEVLNVYAAILLRTVPDLPPHHPRVFHFAYQQKNAIDRLWRPYGVIIALGDQVRLIAESGNWQEATSDEFRQTAVVETFFGPRPTLFRIASIHDFTYEVEPPSAHEGVVRFL